MWTASRINSGLMLQWVLCLIKGQKDDENNANKWCKWRRAQQLWSVKYRFYTKAHRPELWLAKIFDAQHKCAIVFFLLTKLHLKIFAHKKDTESKTAVIWVQVLLIMTKSLHRLFKMHRSQHFQRLLNILQQACADIFHLWKLTCLTCIFNISIKMTEYWTADSDKLWWMSLWDMEICLSLMWFWSAGSNVKSTRCEYVIDRTCLQSLDAHMSARYYSPSFYGFLHVCMSGKDARDESRAVPRWRHTLRKSLPIPPVPQQTLALIPEVSREKGGSVKSTVGRVQ